MKKLLLLASAVVLLAAACNASTPSSQTPTSNRTGQVQRPSKVDETVSQLNASVDSEDAINLESDDDVIYSDSSVISGYDGVSNANY